MKGHKMADMLHENIGYEKDAFKYCPVCGGKFISKSEIAKECSMCGYTYYISANPSAGAIIVTENDEVLLVRRSRDPFNGMLDIPAGFADCPETYEQALERELKEEVGLSLGGQQYRYWKSMSGEYEYKGVIKYFLTAIFIIKITEDTKVQLTAGDDASEIVYIDLADLDLNEVGFPEVKQLLHDFAAQFQGK